MTVTPERRPGWQLRGRERAAQAAPTSAGRAWTSQETKAGGSKTLLRHGGGTGAGASRSGAAAADPRGVGKSPGRAGEGDLPGHARPEVGDRCEDTRSARGPEAASEAPSSAHAGQPGVRRRELPAPVPPPSRLRPAPTGRGAGAVPPGALATRRHASPAPCAPRLLPGASPTPCACASPPCVHLAALWGIASARCAPRAAGPEVYHKGVSDYF